MNEHEKKWAEIQELPEELFRERVIENHNILMEEIRALKKIIDEGHHKIYYVVKDIELDVDMIKDFTRERRN